MPESQQPSEGQQIMISRILSGSSNSVLDVGAGDGKWGKLLRGMVKKITALEIWPEYVERYKLRDIYDEVIIEDAKDFDRWDEFDVVILGDVLEHMTKEEGIKLVQALRQSQAKVYLTIPITACPQDGTVYKNPYETHQSQWSDEELKTLGWLLLHKGPNPNGKVIIGTYVLETPREKRDESIRNQ